MESGEQLIGAVIEVLHERIPGFPGTLDGFDRARITAFVEAGDFGDRERLKEDVDCWAQEVAVDQQTAGDPLTATALIVCLTIAYVRTVESDPEFPIKAVREVRGLIETVLTDNAAAKVLLDLLHAWFRAGAPHP